jgi:hypothetical protein
MEKDSFRRFLVSAILIKATKAHTIPLTTVICKLILAFPFGTGEQKNPVV